MPNLVRRHVFPGKMAEPLYQPDKTFAYIHFLFQQKKNKCPHLSCLMKDRILVS